MKYWMLLGAWCVSCTGPEPLSPSEPSPGAVHYVVMTYNVHRDRSHDAGTVEAVGAPHADIVCLQEPTVEWERVLRARYAEQYPYMLFHPRDDAGGLGILSRFPMTDDGVMYVEPTWHPTWHAIVHAPAGDLQIFNVHLRAVFDGSPNPVSSYAQTSEDHVTEIKAFMSKGQPKTPTLVLGDFNEGPRGETVEWLEAQGFKNALALYHPGQYTWHAPSVGGSLDMAIDHILFDGAFEPLNSWIEKNGASDHFPVLAHLELTPEVPEGHVTPATPQN